MEVKICKWCGDDYEPFEPEFFGLDKDIEVCLLCLAEEDAPKMLQNIKDQESKEPKKIKMVYKAYYMHISKNGSIYDLKCPECGHEDRLLVKNEQYPFCKKCLSGS